MLSHSHQPTTEKVFSCENVHACFSSCLYLGSGWSSGEATYETTFTGEWHCQSTIHPSRLLADPFEPSTSMCDSLSWRWDTGSLRRPLPTWDVYDDLVQVDILYCVSTYEARLIQLGLLTLNLPILLAIIFFSSSLSHDGCFVTTLNFISQLTSSMQAGSTLENSSAISDCPVWVIS